MPKRTPLDWEDLERELHTAGVSPEEIEAGARRLLAQSRGHQLAETRKQLTLGQKQIAAAMGVSIARESQIEHGEVTSFQVIARYVEALGGRLITLDDRHCSDGGSTRAARGRRGLVTDLVTPLPSGYDRSAATLMWSVCFPEGKSAMSTYTLPRLAGGALVTGSVL